MFFGFPVCSDGFSGWVVFVFADGGMFFGFWAVRCLVVLDRFLGAASLGVLVSRSASGLPLVSGAFLLACP